MREGPRLCRAVFCIDNIDMDTFCQKYSETVPEDDIRCRHLKDYCKFRTGCIVFFMTETEEPGAQPEASAPDDSGSS